MRNSPNRLTTAVGATLAVCVLISIGFFFTVGNNRAYRTLFFPSADRVSPGLAVSIAGEKRRVPAHRNLQDNAGQLVQELILGPSDPTLRPLLGPGTRLIAVVAAGRDVYVNLTADLLLSSGPLPAEAQIQAIASNLAYNFPRVRRIYVLIDGQTPDFSPMTGDPRYDFSHGVSPRTELVQ